MGVLDYEADIESDLSAFHRIDDPMTIDGPRYFRLALRLSAYTGALQARLAAEDAEREGHGSSAQSAAHSPARGTTKAQYVPDAAAIAMLGSDIDYARGTE